MEFLIAVLLAWTCCNTFIIMLYAKDIWEKLCNTKKIKEEHRDGVY